MAEADIQEAKSRTAKKPRVRPPQTFRHFKPETQGGGKAMVRLCQSDLIRGVVQVVKKGEGDNNLHLHTGMDTVWFVIRGQVKFYGENDVVMGEFGPGEGILMPRNNAYWFAAEGEDDLELLQVAAFDREVKNERVDLEDQRFEVGTAEYFDGRTG